MKKKGAINYNNILQFDLFQKPVVVKRDLYKKGKYKRKPTLKEIDEEFMARATATGFYFEDKKNGDIGK